jgi:EmrB/QacA subfamily drug resistance transporter
MATISERSRPLADASQPTPYPLRWPAAVVMLVAVLMDLIDGTIVNVALPRIHADLHATGAQVQWVVAAYMLAFAAVLITAGNAGDLLGRKRIFLLGTALFALASLGSGIAQTPDELIIARAVQGAAAGVMTPQLLATFRAMFSGAELGQAFGLYGMMGGFATAIGLLAGGALTSANLFGWQWRTVFLINLPIAVITLVAGRRCIPETRGRERRKPDISGAALLVLALIAIVYPILEGRQNSWPVWGWLMLGTGMLLLGALLVVHATVRRRRVAPLVAVSSFRSLAFSAGQAVQLAFSAGLQGFFLIFALWVQSGQHYSPLRAGLTTVAFSLGSFLLAAIAIPLAQRHGRLVLVAGGVLLAAGVIGVSIGARHVGATTNPWPLVPGLAIAGIGLSLLIIPLANVVLSAVPREVAGSTSGLFSTVQQIGGAIGIAAIGGVFLGHVHPHGYRAAFIDTVPIVAAVFLLAAAIALVLPKTALGENEALELI